MRILLPAVLAVFLGSASAYIENSGTYFDTDYVKGTWEYKYEYAYSTQYSAEVYEDYWIRDAYGFRVWANLTTYCEFEIFEAYTVGIENVFTLFDITPYEQVVRYIKTEFVNNGEVAAWDAAIEGLFTVKALELETNIYQNVKTMTFSFYDFFDNIDDSDYIPFPDEKDDFAFDDDYETSYTDPYWTHNFLDIFFGTDDLPFFGEDRVWFSMYVVDKTKDRTFMDYFVPPKPEVVPPGPGPLPDPDTNPFEL